MAGFSSSLFPFNGNPQPVINDLAVVKANPGLTLTDTVTSTEAIVRYVNGNIWLAINADYQAGAAVPGWYCINPVNAAYALELTQGFPGTINYYIGAAGTGAIYWNSLFNSGSISTSSLNGTISASQLAYGAAAANIGVGGVNASMLALGAAAANIGVGGVNSTMLAAGVAAANLGAGGVTSSLLAPANALTQIGWYSIRDFGADNSGQNSCNQAFINAQAAATGQVIWFPPGTYLVTSNFTFTSPVMLAPGAVFSVPSGVTLTFPPTFQAPQQQAFLVAGSVGFTQAPLLVYPEWWGALGNGTNNDAPAINAALNSVVTGGKIKLGPKPYKITAPLVFKHNNTILEGTTVGLGPYDSGTNVASGTQIIGVNGVNGITITALSFCELRDFALSIPSGATTACAGITWNQCFLGKSRNLRLTNWSTGIYLLGPNTDMYTDHCYVTSVGCTIGPIGIEVNGAAGQTATCYISHCICAHANATGTSYGYLALASAQDTYFDYCEADTSTYGFALNGAGGGTYSGADIHFNRCVADQCTTAFYILNMPAGSAVTIEGGWAESSTNGQNVIYVTSSYNVSIKNMQIYTTLGATSMQGVLFNSCTSCSLIGNQITGMTIGARFTACSAINVACNEIFANNGQATAGIYALYFSNTSRSNMNSNTTGGTASPNYGTAYLFDSSSTYNNFVGNNATGCSTLFTNQGSNNSAAGLTA